MVERKQLVRAFIVDTLLFGDDSGLADDTPFLAQGIVDSTGFLELVLFLEETFGIKVEDAELVPENLDSLELIDRYLQAKLETEPQAAPVP